MATGTIKASVGRADANEDIYSSITWTVAPSANNSKFIRNGHCYELTYCNTTAKSYGTTAAIGTIGTAAYRPTCAFYVSGFHDTDGKPVNGGIYIATDGTITYYGTALTNIKLDFHATWVNT